jgi:hypothetical protein
MGVPAKKDAVAVELDEDGGVADPCHRGLAPIVQERPQIGSHGGEGSHP